ncbi:MAG: NAD(P)-dependent oxidoreductase [Pseudonocardiaceae bacterium]|nr:NAD(P)-dependent oxidoreductase [Pseudonocardiaceae bacterium]
MTEGSRTPVSVLGLGSMGAALAGALLRSGYPTTVWNRSGHKADDLVARGAVRAGTAADAVAASRTVIICVSDDEAVREILDGVGAAVSGRVLVNLTTATPDQARARADWAARRDVDYLDGVIQAGHEIIGTPDALLLYSGSQGAFDGNEAALRELGRATYLGADAGLACLYDLALLGMWYEVEVGYLHTLAMLGDEQVDATEFAPFATELLTHVVGSLADTAREVRDGHYPRGAAYLREHAPVLRQAVQMRQRRGADVARLEHIEGLVAQRIADGHSDDGLTGVIEAIKKSSGRVEPNRTSSS